MKEYVCVCGRVCDNSQKFNGHRSQCKVYLLQKYGSEDYIKSRHDNISASAKRYAEATAEDRAHIKAAKQQAKLLSWLSTNPICENCGKAMTAYYGSGRFCSEACARSFTTKDNRDVINAKISKSMKCHNYSRNITRISKKQCRKQARALKLQEYLDHGYEYLRYYDIDFGCNYLVNRMGIVVSVKYLRELKHTAYSTDGYRRLVLSDVLGQSHMIYLHRIVAYMFIPNPNNLPIINHIDENPSNNCADNLEWCTVQYNNTYNDVHLRRGKVYSENIKRNGGPWNKGKHSIISDETRHKMAAAAKRRGFVGNQYVDKYGNLRK